MKLVPAIIATAIVSILTTVIVVASLRTSDTRSATVPEPATATGHLQELGAPARSGHAPPRPPHRNFPPAAGEVVEDEAELQAQVDSVMRSLEDRFRTEAVSPVWAHNTELAVLGALVSDEAESAGVALPLNVEVRCRSSLCRIDADYSDDAAAADAATILAMDISEHLPRTHRRTVYRPDGSVQLLIFAMQ